MTDVVEIPETLHRAVRKGWVTPISLGPDCLVAAELERLDLRPAAYPFDYIVSSLGMVEHCLDDGFRTFLDPDHMHPLGGEGAGHRFYAERFGIHPVFMHHDMPRKTNHFRRAIDRFVHARNPVYIHLAREAPDPALVARVRAKLGGKMLVYVSHPSRREPGFASEGEIIVFRARDKMAGYGFRDPEDARQFAEELVRQLMVVRSGIVHAPAPPPLGQLDG